MENTNVAATNNQKATARRTKAKMNEFFLDHANRTITLTKQFAQRTNTPGSAEYRQFLDLRKDFPEYGVEIRTIKKNQKRMSTKGLKCAFMKNHISTLYGENSAQYKEFERQDRLSQAYINPYMYMRKWFLAKYPDWNTSTEVEDAEQGS
jgi:hypothetical protein